MNIKKIEREIKQYISADMVVFDRKDFCLNHEKKLDMEFINKQQWLNFLQLDINNEKIIYTDEQGDRYKFFGKILNKYIGKLYLTNDKVYNAIHNWGSWWTADCKYCDLIMGDIKFKAIYKLY